MKLIKIDKSDGKNRGYCNMCEKYFKKNEYIIRFDKAKVNYIMKKKVCVYCYLSILADKIGWSKINALILKLSERKI